MGLVSSLVKRAKRSKNRGNVFTVAELADYIGRALFELIGKRRRAWHENPVDGKVEEKIENSVKLTMKQSYFY